MKNQHIMNRIRRAGVPPDSPSFETLMTVLFKSPAISVHGFYAHAGNSYQSTSMPEAVGYLSSEVVTANDAATLALKMLPESPNAAFHSQPFVLSVGSTPTAHAASAESKKQLASLLNGSLELHAGKCLGSQCGKWLLTHATLYRELYHAGPPAKAYGFD
jgi:D-serine ammonia-lyase